MKIQLKKEYLPLIVAISLPILLFFSVWIANYIPALFYNPKYDFIYFRPQYLTPGLTSIFYKVDPISGEIIKDDIRITSSSYNNGVDLNVEKTKVEYPQLYLHNTVTNTSRAISLKEAQRYILIDTDTSPDGYRIEPGRQVSYSLFFPSSYRDYSEYVMNYKGYIKSLNLVKGQYNDPYGYGYDYGYGSNSLKVLGWTQR